MLKKIKIFFISVLFFTLGRYAMAAVPQIQIIPRTVWGADEAKRFNKDSEELWPEEYAGIKKIIIHHTAGTNGGEDPQATVRAIYDYHANGRGWGDIGYNYLVDRNGNIYEGRVGGDGVIGGHAYDDTRNIGWNSGTIGISIIGTYGGWVSEPKQGYYLEHPNLYDGRVKFEKQVGSGWQIYLEDALTPQTEESLANLIAVKSLDYGIDPMGVSDFNGKTLPNVIGHRDVDFTTCPGDELYGKLSEIRNKAEEKYKTIISSGVKRGATLLGDKEINISLKKDETKEITLQFRNDGDLTWHNYTDDKLILTDASAKSHLAMINGVSLALDNSASNTEASAATSSITVANYQMMEHNVKPGEVGTFKLTLSYPKDKIVDEKSLVLALQDKGWFPGTDIKVSATAIDLSYKGELESNTLPPAMMENSKKEITIKIRNTGIKSWYKEKNKNSDTGTQVYLKLSDKSDKSKESKFYDSSWPDKFGLIKPEETEITPGNYAAFKFKINVQKPGYYRTQFALTRIAEELEKKPELEIFGAVFDTLTRVDSPLQAELIEAKVPQAMLNIWTSKAEFKIKNTGSVTWDKNFSLKVLTAEGKESPFKDKSWDKKGNTIQLPAKIVPGQMAIMAPKLKAPKTPGTYNVAFILTYKGKPIYVNYMENLVYNIRIDEAKK